MNQGDETRPFVATLGSNDRVTTDSATIQGLETPFTIRTISTIDPASIGGTEAQIDTDLQVHDLGDAAAVESPAAFSAVIPAPADIVLEGLQPSVSVDEQSAIAPNVASLVVAGQLATVLSTARILVDFADPAISGQAPNVLAGRGVTGAAEIVLTGLQAGVAYGHPVNTTDSAGVTATEDPVARKTIASIDQGELAGTENAIDTDLQVHDLGDIAATGAIQAPSGVVQPATAVIQLLALQPAVAIPPGVSASPETASLTLGGAQPVVISRLVVTAFNPVALTVQGQQPDVRAATAIPAAAGITVRGLLPFVQSRRAVAAGAGSVSIEGLRCSIFASGGWSPEVSASAAWADVAGAARSWTDTTRESGTWTVIVG